MATKISKAEMLLPKFASADFIPPLDLNDEEKEVWVEITDLLRESAKSKVSDADHELTRQYCQLTVARNRAWREYNLKPERYTKIVIGICADGKRPKSSSKTTSITRHGWNVTSIWRR